MLRPFRVVIMQRLDVNQAARPGVVLVNSKEFVP